MSEEDDLPSWDAFVSHASEDKEGVVRPVAAELMRLGVATWYDEFELKPGDSLRQSIDAGLRQSKAGILVLSKAFLSKKWTKYELDGLNSLALHEGRRLVPLWHGIDHGDVLKFSPTLADRVAIVTGGRTSEEIALRIAEVIRPDIYERVLRRRVMAELEKTATKVQADPKTVRPGPVRHKELSREMMVQIRLLRAALLPFYPHSQSFWVDGFSRDMRPERELAWWSHLAACVLEYAVHRGFSVKESRKVLFEALFAMKEGQVVDEDKAAAAEIDLDFARSCIEHLLPVNDFDEPDFDEIWGQVRPASEP